MTSSTDTEVMKLTSAVSSAAVQFVAIVTHTAEHSRKVLACSKYTDVLEVTLINVCGEGDRKEFFFLNYLRGHREEK